MIAVGALFASEPPRELTDELVRPGWLGFGLFLALVVASVFLFRSMNHQLKKIDFDEDAPTNGSADGSACEPMGGPAAGSTDRSEFGPTDGSASRREDRPTEAPNDPADP